MKYANTIAELVTADGASAKDLTMHEVWRVSQTSGSAPRFDVERLCVGVGRSARDGWAFIDCSCRCNHANESAIDTDTIFVSEARARQRQAELYLAAAVEMTRTSAAAIVGGAAQGAVS